MKKYIPTIIFALVFLTGLSIMLYPTVSNAVNTRNQSRVMSNYNAVVAKMDPADYTREWDRVKAYNDYIGSFPDIATAVAAEQDNNDGMYERVLNLDGNGVMGIIRIPSINVSLPMYHTAEDAVLQVGIGHYVGSSVPGGGTGTHCLLTGHRGLPSAKLFTDLDQIGVGDKFFLAVLDQTLAYQVDQIQTVLPEEMDGLSVLPDQDYVTLVTCTPYGINSHRLLIRGTRVEYQGELDAEKGPVYFPGLARDGATGLDMFPFAVAGVILIGCLTAAGLIKRSGNRRKH